MRAATIREAFGIIGPTFSFGAFGEILQPMIHEVLESENKGKFRKGTILIGNILMWLVLVITIRRDLAYSAALNWMVKDFRWLQKLLPAENSIVADGAISKARVKLGISSFRALFNKLRLAFCRLPTDFAHFPSVGFDGSTATMPDSESNEKHFKKPSSRCLKVEP